MADTAKKRTSTRKKTTAPKATAETAAPVEQAAPVEEIVQEVKAAPAPIQMVVEEKAPPVKILYIDSVISNNQIAIGNGRYITGSGRIFAVPLEQFEGEFMSTLVMSLIDERKFIVLDGLTDEQRLQYNCYYAPGEVVKNEGLFDSLLNMPTDKAAEIYEQLCPSHKRLVATRFVDAFEKRDNRITRDKVEALNAISKSVDADGLFTPIVREINERMSR